MPTPPEGPGAKALKALGSGLASLDAFAVTTSPTLDGYIAAVSEYVLNQRTMTARSQSGLKSACRPGWPEYCGTPYISDARAWPQWLPRSRWPAP